MIQFELIRVHTKSLDYRNAYRVCVKMAGQNPSNPFVLSRCGRLCLEIGQKKTALNYFNHVQALTTPFVRNAVLTADAKVDESQIQVLLNEAFLSIYDSDYKSAQATLREILRLKPQNLVATNNIAVC